MLGIHLRLLGLLGLFFSSLTFAPALAQESRPVQTQDWRDPRFPILQPCTTYTCHAVRLEMDYFRPLESQKAALSTGLSDSSPKDSLQFHHRVFIDQVCIPTNRLEGQENSAEQRAWLTLDRLKNVDKSVEKLAQSAQDEEAKRTENSDDTEFSYKPQLDRSARIDYRSLRTVETTEIALGGFGNPPAKLVLNTLSDLDLLKVHLDNKNSFFVRTGDTVSVLDFSDNTGRQSSFLALLGTAEVGLEHRFSKNASVYFSCGEETKTIMDPNGNMLFETNNTFFFLGGAFRF